MADARGTWNEGPRLSARRRALWIGFSAALLALAILLVLQYRWLADLERTSSIARRAAHDNFVEAVASNVELTYSKAASYALSFPVSLLDTNEKKASSYLDRKKAKGARALFLIGFGDGAVEAFSGDVTEESKIAAWLAAYYWRGRAKKGTPVVDDELWVSEEDPGNRLIVNPLFGEEGTIRGIAGMVVDEDYFREDALPLLVKKALPDYASKRELMVAVWDGRGELVMGEPLDREAEDLIVRRPEFVFTDWEIGIRGRDESPEQWARANFLLNSTLSAVLAAVLVGGVLLSLRAASKAVKLSEMKDEFVSNVSHELRTPLASIRVFGELLRHGKVRDEEQVRQYGEHIDTEGRRLTQLIGNILDFSQIESGKKEYQPRETDLEELVERVAATFSVRFERAGLALELERPGSPLPPLAVDPGALSQAIANLIDNAIKYSNGGERVRVKIEREEREVVIAVRDEGIGIEREEQSKIFDRFHRVPTGLVHDVKGSGLGLAIVSHVVEAHGGRVTVDSVPGRGSTFAIRLPASADRGSLGHLAPQEGV